MSDIVKRIRKLLDLSRSSSDAEAALAASRAADLMRKHALTEAEIRLTDGRAAEAIVEGDTISAKKRIAYQNVLAFAVAELYGCKAWNHLEWSMASSRQSRATVRVMGRESAVQAASYTSQYLIREVDRICDETWEREGDEAQLVGQTVRTWKNSFRLGAAGAISRRIHAQVRDQVAERAVKRAAARASRDEGAAPQAPEEIKPDALALVAREEEEVAQAYAAKSKGFRQSSSIGRVRNRTGYSAGQQAGGKISLGGGRAAIGQGAAKLRGGE